MPDLKSAIAVAAAAGAAVLIASCASGPQRDTPSAAAGSAGPAVRAPQSAGTTSHRIAQSDAPPIDWEHILRPGVRTSVAAAHHRGHLSFVPIAPRFGVAPDKVLVSDPRQVPAAERSVAYLLHFPTGPNFPASRTTVVVMEAPSQISVAQLTSGARSNTARFGADAFKLLHYGAIPAELISAHGVGRIHTIIRGIGIDITGPAVSPAAVQELGRQLTAGLG